MSFPLVAFLALPVLLYVLSSAIWRDRSGGRPLPPGPTSFPLVGNLSYMRKPQLWKAHRDLCVTYNSDIVHLKVLGQHICILGSPKSIFALLDKRSSVTSDREHSPLVRLCGQGFQMSLMPYGAWWRRHRRAFWQHFYPTATEKYRSVQKQSAHMFLRKLLEDPSDLYDHIRYTFSATIVKVTYGVDVAEKNDPYIALIEKVLAAIVVLTPGRYLLQYLPILEYVPEWVPGAGFQKELSGWRAAADYVKETLFAKSVELLDLADPPQSIVAQLVGKVRNQDDRPSNPDSGSAETEMDIAKNVALSIFEAAADTTFSTLQAFFLAMSLCPDVQKKAQAQLDAVVGPHRLPDHEDQEALPYISAIVKEALRWHVVLPFSIPHLTTEDMEYEGYFIPKGTALLGNKPERFNPDRYLDGGELDPNAPDPSRFVFGYGRRTCPGRYFANSSLFINIAFILHTFNITPPLDEQGKAIVIEHTMTETLTSYPEDFRCTVKPRSDRARQLVLAES
ncbi:cytochrome P450 [Ganoderma sinense ZZ0214-1]|uniref:Cytochrome P450 n=1 Tax=Ganoderma sinense ZZ0214-1 TaxID=1077348 RepID=A0A2G8RMN4_9APHY|nr:cytochrome P450 [Ganoderma sinense ZZ0214-1]